MEESKTEHIRRLALDFPTVAKTLTFRVHWMILLFERSHFYHMFCWVFLFRFEFVKLLQCFLLEICLLRFYVSWRLLDDSNWVHSISVFWTLVWTLVWRCCKLLSHLWVCHKQFGLLLCKLLKLVISNSLLLQLCPRW